MSRGKKSAVKCADTFVPSGASVTKADTYKRRAIRSVRSLSLGTGFFPKNGPIHFAPGHSASICSAATASETEDEDSVFTPVQTDKDKESTLSSVQGKNNRQSTGPSSSFIRACDLGIHDSLKSSQLELPPPPACIKKESDMWVGLDLISGGDSDVSHSAFAPLVVQALAKAGIGAALDETMWTPEKKTEKLLKERRERLQGGGHMFDLSDDGTGRPCDKEVLIWTGMFSHNCYGHELPAVRSRGVVAMSPEALVDLLIDSNRVSLYNKMSLGRTDELVLSSDMHTDGPMGKGVTKVVKSRSKVPMIRKPLEFVTLLHARQLVADDQCGEGFVMVSRGVTMVPSEDRGGSEILMNVNLIRAIDGVFGKCEMININHLKSPGVPVMIAKKIGLSGAAGFVNDLRALC